MAIGDLRSKEWAICALKALGLAILIISPVGAPLVGYAIVYACDIPWEGPVQCAVPEPLLGYFLRSVFVPWAVAGPFLAILWQLLSLGLLASCLWFAGKAIWLLTLGRP